MTDRIEGQFQLDSRLESSTAALLDWPLCRVLLARDANYPWLILVPRRERLRELHELCAEDLAQAMREVVAASSSLERCFDPDKLNVAALGNQVPQLHIHVVARYDTDPAWPNPVWGTVPPAAYTPERLEERLRLLRRELGEGP